MATGVDRSRMESEWLVDDVVGNETRLTLTPLI